MNQCVIVGRLTRDPQVRATPQGKTVINFSVAVNKKVGQEKRVNFIDCVMWTQYPIFYEGLSKGRAVLVSGEIQSRNYENKQGQRVYITEVLCNRVNLLHGERSQETKQTISDVANEDPKQDASEAFLDDLPF